MQFELLKNHEGLLILGATDDFRAFHEVVHDVNERSPIINDKEGLFLGLAYDFRKAFEGQRHIRVPQHDDAPVESSLVGFEILWPTILVQCRMLREALAFIDNSKRHQVLAYSLEVIVDEALPLDFPTNHSQVHRAYQAIDPAHPFLESKASSRIEHWYRWKKKERKARLVELLESLDPMFEHDYRYRINNGATGLLSPNQWDAGDSLPDEESTLRH